MRSNLITRLRVFATIVVVAYHCACPYGYWCWEGYQGDTAMARQMVTVIFLRILCNTMLPVFFMISGMLFYAKEEKYLNDRKVTFWRKFDRLMIPYFIILVLCLWLDLPSIGLALAQGHLWFVRALFIIFLFSLVLSKLPKWVLMCLGGAFYTIFILCCKYSIQLPGMVEQFFNYYIFFIGGYYFKKHLVVLRGSLILKWILIIAWLAALLIGIRSVIPLLFCVMIVCLMPDSTIRNKWVQMVDKDSFAIYLIHHVLIFALFQIPLIQYMYATMACVAIPTMFVIIIVLSLFVSELLHRIEFRYF